MTSHSGLKTVAGSRNPSVTGKVAHADKNVESPVERRQMLLFIPAYPNMDLVGGEYPCFMPCDGRKLPTNVREVPMPVIDPRTLEQMLSKAQPFQAARSVKSSPAFKGDTKEMVESIGPQLMFIPPFSKKSRKQLPNSTEPIPVWHGMRRIDIERNNKVHNLITPTLNVQQGGDSKPTNQEAPNEGTYVPKPRPTKRTLELAKPRIRKVDEYVKSYISPKSVPSATLSDQVEELVKSKDYNSTESSKENKPASKVNSSTKTKAKNQNSQKEANSEKNAKSSDNKSKEEKNGQRSKEVAKERKPKDNHSEQDKKKDHSPKEDVKEKRSKNVSKDGVSKKEKKKGRKATESSNEKGTKSASKDDTFNKQEPKKGKKPKKDSSSKG